MYKMSKWWQNHFKILFVFVQANQSKSSLWPNQTLSIPLCCPPLGATRWLKECSSLNQTRVTTAPLADFGVSISKVFVNFREGKIRAKICHFRDFFYFRWYSMTIIYFRQIFVVLPQDKLLSITFETDKPQPAGGRLHLNPLTTVFLPTWMTNWTTLEEEIAGEVAAFPRGSSKPSRSSSSSISFTHFKGFRQIPICLMLHSDFRQLLVILLNLW